MQSDTFVKQKSNLTEYWIKRPGPRRPFADYICFLWGDGRDCDCEGDAKSPTDRNWTELTIINRTDESERVDVDPYALHPLTFVIRSERPELAARLAYALAATSGGTLTASPEGTPIIVETLLSHVGHFDLEAALQRLG
jgi:hypothetical protein